MTETSVKQRDLPARSAGVHTRTADSAAFQPTHVVDGRRFWSVFAALLMVLLLAALDNSILNTALPHIAGELGSLSLLSWAVSAFMLTSILSTPIYGKLADRHGGKPVLCVAICLFLLGSALCGFSRTLPELALYRGLQGLGAGGLVALAQVLIAELVGPERRAHYQGFFAATFAVSNLAGPLLGAALTIYFSWRWIFFINLPLGIIALTLIAINLHGIAGRPRHELDYRGMCYLTLTTLPLLLCLNLGAHLGWSSAVVPALAVTSVICGTLFFKREISATRSFLGLHLIQDRTFVASAGAAIWLGFSTIGVNVYLPLWFQAVQGMDPLESGLMLIPKILAMMLTGIFGVRMLLRHYSYRTIISIGLILEVIAVAGMTAGCYADAPPWFFQVHLALMGAGMGIAWPNVITLLQNRVARKDLGTATSAMTFLRELGGAVGVASAGAIVATLLSVAGTVGAHAGMPGPEQIGSYRHALGLVFCSLSLGMLAALLSVLTLPSSSAHRSPA